jgi:hypothetical protein
MRLTRRTGTSMIKVGEAFAIRRAICWWCTLVVQPGDHRRDGGRCSETGLDAPLIGEKAAAAAEETVSPRSAGAF